MNRRNVSSSGRSRSHRISPRQPASTKAWVFSTTWSTVPTRLSARYCSVDSPPQRSPPPSDSHQARASASVSKSRQSGPWVRVMSSKRPAHLLAVPRQQARLALERLQAHLPVGQVGPSGGDTEVDLLPAATHQHGGQLLDRLRIAVGPVEVQVVAVEGDRLLGPQPPDHLERLVEDGQAHPVGRVLVAVGVVLLVEPAGTEPEDEPSARVHVDAGGLLGQQTGVAVGGASHQLTEAHPLGALGEGGQHGEGLEHVGRLPPWHRLDVVVDPHMVVAEGLGQAGQLDRARPGIGATPTGVLELPALGDENADFQRSPPPAGPLTWRTPTTGPRTSSAAGT